MFVSNVKATLKLELERSPLVASSALKTNPRSLIIGELPAGNVFYTIAATFKTLNWSRSDPFGIALAAMAPNVVAIGFCDRSLPLLQLVWGELGI